jgi:ornithine cyclodeaminase
MRIIDADAVEKALAYPGLVDDLESAFRTGAIAPLRHHHPIALADRPDAMLLLMPAWQSSAPGRETAGFYAGVKLVTVFPDNGARYAKPAIYGTYVLISAETGETLALIDAPRLTVWRTAAASALASRFLSRPNATRLTIIGAGALAPYLARAHASVRPIREIEIWNRSADGAAKVATGLRALGFEARAVTDLEASVRRADIVSTATLSSTPVVQGAWLSPGAHLDCVGAYKPSMRESDDACVRRARIWVDTRNGSLNEAGDILIPLKAGVIRESDILGDLSELARGTAPRRTSENEITMFKSVGAAIEDLAGAIAVYEATRPASVPLLHKGGETT